MWRRVIGFIHIHKRYGEIRWLNEKAICFSETLINIYQIRRPHTIITIIISGVRLSSLHTAAATLLSDQPPMIDEGDCGATGGMKIDNGNRSTRRKPAPAPLCPPQIPYDQIRARTHAAAVGSQQLTPWAMARLWRPYLLDDSKFIVATEGVSLALTA
jgi:hypothetical protein